MSDTNNQLDLLAEARPEQLAIIDAADRSEWSKGHYESAFNTCREIKGYSQWLVAKLATEVLNRDLAPLDWVAQVAGLDVNTVYQYKYVFTQLIKENPKFEVDGYFPWNVIQLVVREKIKLGLNEKYEDIFNELKDKGQATAKGAYRTLKEKEQVAKGEAVEGQVLEPAPSRPKINMNYNSETKLYEIVVSEGQWVKIDTQHLLQQLEAYNLV